MITQNELKDLVTYEPTTGIFIAKVKWSNRAKKVGEILGVFAIKGSGISYLETSINKQKYYLHRLAFLYMEGVIPTVVDHIDGNGLNNRWNNLYNGTQRNNNQNTTRIMSNKIDQLPLGVFKHRNKFTAAIKYNYKKIHLGVFTTVVEAAQAYQDAKVIYHVR
jgi:hypothetical protein